MTSQSPMYRAFVEVVPEASGFTGALTGQVTTSAAAAGKTGGKAAGASFVSGFGKALPLLGAGIAALGLGDIIGDAIGNAGDYQQNVGAVRDVFQDAAGAVQKFADGADKTLGLSANQALVGARNFGTFGKAAGLAGDDLSTFSTDLLGLGADLAAFGNTTPEEAVAALSAGLRGESEPLRRYGVLLDDAALRARALELGIYDGNGALTAQQKILAANAEIWAQTGTQQGKAAEDAKTLAGRNVALAASWENASTKIGTAFLPIAEDVVAMITDELIPAIGDFAEWLNQPETQDGIATFGESLRETGNFIRDWFIAPIGAALAGVVNFAEVLNGKISFTQFIDRMTEIPGFFGDVFKASADMGNGIQRTIGQMILRVQDFSVETGRNIAAVVSFFVGLPGRIGAALGGAGEWLYNSGRAVIQGFLDGIGSMFKPINDVMGGVMDFIAGFFPHSPAERGAFAGSGWTQLAQSGAAMAEQLASGLMAQYKDIQKSSATRVGASGSSSPVADRVVVQQTVNPAKGMSEPEIARISAERLGFVLRRV